MRWEGVGGAPGVSSWLAPSTLIKQANVNKININNWKALAEISDLKSSERGTSQEKMRLQVIFKPRTDDGEDAKIKIVMPFFGNTTVAQFVAGAVQRYEYFISQSMGSGQVLKGRWFKW